VVEASGWTYTRSRAPERRRARPRVRCDRGDRLLGLRPRASRPVPDRAAGEPQDAGKNPEDAVWAQLAFPFYMQSSSPHNPSVCEEFENTLREAEGGAPAEERPACVWRAIRCAAAAAAAAASRSAAAAAARGAAAGAQS
jgi:hypothetical protein